MRQRFSYKMSNLVVIYNYFKFQPHRNLSAIKRKKYLTNRSSSPAATIFHCLKTEHERQYASEIQWTAPLMKVPQKT